MQPNEYQQLALRTEHTPEFVTPPPPITVERGTMLARLIHASIGMCTETGELQDMVKKHLIYRKPFDQVNVLEECGDVMWYIAVALDACGYTMEEAMERNIAKLKARFGDKFSQESALNRDLKTERSVLEGNK